VYVSQRLRSFDCIAAVLLCSFLAIGKDESQWGELLPDVELCSATTKPLFAPSTDADEVPFALLRYTKGRSTYEQSQRLDWPEQGIIDFRRGGCSRRDCTDHHFAFGALLPSAPGSDIDRLLLNWYSRGLRRMNEPTLTCRTIVGETYRILVVPTYGSTTIVRVNVVKNASSVTVAKVAGNGGFSIGGLFYWSNRAIGRQIAADVSTAFDSNAFWSLPTRDDREYGRDGFHWIIEARVGQRYNVVDRWSPKQGPVHELGQLLLKLGRQTSE
jgi:hypothetical protein